MPVRRAVRALLLDPDASVLLMRVTEPRSRRASWITPGGGLDDGEGPHDALRRELREELGYDLATDAIGPQVWSRRATFTWDGREYEQHEDFFLVPTEHFSPEHCVEGDPGDTWDVPHAWWTSERITASSDTFFPSRLGVALAAILSDGPPGEPYDVGV